MARLEDGTPVPEETPEELAQPIISRAHEVLVIRRGELSGLMDNCSMDWEQHSYLPLMRWFRSQGWTGKPMAYVGLLHGMSQGLTEGGLGSRSECSPAERAALADEAASLSAGSE